MSCISFLPEGKEGEPEFSINIPLLKSINELEGKLETQAVT